MLENDAGRVVFRCATVSEDETFELGRQLGALVDTGVGIALAGELGAGKTVFVRGLAHGLGVDEPDEVRSPTYLLMIEHKGPKPLLHMDAYFAERSRDFLDDGGDAYVRDGFVLAVEWADRLGIPIPEGFLRVELVHEDMQRRRVVMSGLSEGWAAALAALTVPEGPADAG